MDEAGFRRWLGKYLTIPLRSRPPYTPFFLTESARDAYDAEEDDEEPVPLYIRGPHSVASKHVFQSVEEVVEELRAGRVVLRRAEGIRAVSIGEDLFIDGNAFDVPASSSGLASVLADSNAVEVDSLRRALETPEAAR